MRRIAVFLLVLLALPLSGFAESGFSADPPAINEAANSVMLLEVFDEYGRPIATGSGFVAFNNRIVVTNCHVIDNADSIVAYSDDDYEYIVSRVYAADEKADLAILGFYSPTDLTPLKLGVKSEIIRAEPIVAIGSPKGRKNTVSMGNVSSVFAEEGIPYIQFTAPISSGSSGGALFNDLGEVIGVTTSSYDDNSGIVQNLNFAVGISEVQRLFDEMDVENSVTLREYNRGFHPGMTLPTAEPRTAVGTVTRPAIEIIDYSYVDDGIYFVDRDFRISWNADGDLEVYYVRIAEDTGCELVNSATEEQFIDIKASSMSPDRIYTIQIGAKPVNGTYDDVLVSTLRFALETPESTAVPNLNAKGSKANPVLLREPFVFETQILADGSPRIGVTEANFETVRLRISMDNYLTPDYFAAKYRNSYKLTGFEAGTEISLTVESSTGSMAVMPQSAIWITFEGASGEENAGYQVMDAEIAGNYDIAILPRETSKIYKRFAYSADPEMEYMVVTYCLDGQAYKVYFKLDEAPTPTNVPPANLSTARKLDSSKIPKPSDEIRAGLTRCYASAVDGYRIMQIEGYVFADTPAFDGGSDGNSAMLIVTRDSTGETVGYLVEKAAGVTGIEHEGAGKNLEGADFQAFIDVSMYADGDYSLGVALLYKDGGKEVFGSYKFDASLTFSVRIGEIIRPIPIPR